MTTRAPIAAVTGAARGIGYAIAQRLAKDGYLVYIADRDGERGERAAAGLPGARFRAIDVSDDSAVGDLFNEIEREHGGLDGLVNNAAIADPTNPPVASMTPAVWHRRLTTNLTGAYNCTHFAVPLLRARQGAIVNIASTRALQSEPNCEAYAAAKGGLIALTHALAVSLGPDIRVNAISPGWIDTSASPTDSEPAPDTLTPTDHDQHPAGRVGRPDDVAEAAAWLLSERAAFMTGENLVLDGGMTRRMIYAD
jgi:NAD(P)-dependent dehydrogenase (short-subunit alcohol dehydrogenase family)